MDAEATLRDLGIPTDLHEFVTHLGSSKHSWESVSADLEKLSKTFHVMTLKAEMQNVAFINEQIDLILQIPIGVSLPRTFAEPMDPQLTLVLKPLKELAKIIASVCLLGLPNNLKIKMIRSQVHLYSIATAIPLAIGVLNSVAILRLCLDNIIRVYNSTKFSSEEFRDLMNVTRFDPISFERMLVGEIGFTIFRTKEANGRRIETYLKKLCRCLSEYRTNRATFQICDLRRIMYGKNRKPNLFHLHFGRAGKIIFDLAFEVADIPDLLTKWLKGTSQMAADFNQPDLSSDGSWGSMQILRQDGQVSSRISLTTFFGNPHEYQIVTLPVNP